MAFDRLHPAVQHHVVNTLGWRRLRPLQQESITPLLEGKHALLIAPTASGKTEAAVLPLLSRSISEHWTGLGCVYLCPIKALLNNLHLRLGSFLGYFGRRVGLWHGDISAPHRRALLKDPPDVLLTTPESLELMLISSTTDERALFAHLRAVIIDEIHAFAGDDRGWHLISILSRLDKISLRSLQRVGLSATVGNPGQLLDWLVAESPGARRVVAPAGSTPAAAEITVDFVGSTQNAARVIAHLHKGEKRLVFCDSRSRTEQVTALLRGFGVKTFVSHSSLSLDERKQAENAFASGSDCVIVATSTLELGIDVGDLDRVIQIDAPATVRSFLQRLGRTGRREATRRNCLFLATSDVALMHTVGLIDLWREGYVEPVEPPREPHHVLCQQLLALVLQERGLPRCDWTRWLDHALGIGAFKPGLPEQIVEKLLDLGVLWDDQGMLWFTPAGEQQLGHRGFSELLSVFTSEPLLTAMHGPTELGQLHPLALSSSGSVPTTVLLGGRSWLVRRVDWARRIVLVEPTSNSGRSLWKGRGASLSFTLCDRMRRVLTAPDQSVAPEWSARTKTKMAQLRQQHAFLHDCATVVTVDGGSDAVWWTFAGQRANDQLARAISHRTGIGCRASNVSINLDAVPEDQALRESITLAPTLPIPTQVLDEMADLVKFGEYLPKQLLREVITARLADPKAVSAVSSQPIHWSLDYHHPHD